MPENANVAAENNLPVELWDPKSVYYRLHTPAKIHHNHTNWCSNDRGAVTRELDMRHTERNFTPEEYCRLKQEERAELQNITKRVQKFMNRKTVAYPRRQTIVKNDPFGLDSFSVGYSLSKRKRWLLPDYFEENAQEHQHPEEKIWTALATTEIPFIVLNNYPQLFYPPNRYWRMTGMSSIKTMITCNSNDSNNGNVEVKEHKAGRGQTFTYLPPFEIEQTAVVKPNRKLSKRKQRIAAAECQEDPIRIAYYVHDPKSTLNFMNATQQSRENCRSAYRYRDWAHEHREKYPHLVDDEDPFDDSTIDENQECELEMETPPQLTLADFLDEQTWDWLQWESDFVFVASQINKNFSIDDYVFDELDED